MLAYWSKRWVFTPLARIRRTALDISPDPAHPGKQIEEPVGRELAELTDAFNAMSSQLRQERDQLEARVGARTEELRCANERLQREIEERKAIIVQLNASLQEAETLRGILPICSYCKKIRDDQGAWKVIETYIAEHSDAEFSHGNMPGVRRETLPRL
jgi:nitrate/nitrite-specific signal transduction histidine kinase